jgi:hypothetical protein
MYWASAKFVADCLEQTKIGPREPSPPHLLFGSTTTVLASDSESESVDLLCQALQVLRT